MSTSVFSQDTVFFKNQGVAVVKIVEVNTSHVKYTYPSDSTGFVYDTDKNRLLYIKYRNGLVDSIKPVTAIVKTNADVENDIEIEDKKLRYKNKTLNDRKLKFMIDNCPDGEAKLTMLEDYRLMKAYERRQKVYTPIGLACGFIIVPATFIYVIYNADNYNYSTDAKLTTLAAGIIGGAVVRISSVVINTISRNKRYHKRNQIALLYNEVN